MGVLSSKYPNVQAVEDALNKALESVNQTDFNAFKSNVYTKSDTEAYTTEEKNKLSGISEGANKTVIDTTLSSISTNPVQNKVIKTSLDSKANSSDIYTKTESDSRFLGVEGTAKKAVADENGKNISESFATDKNNIAVNKTTLGTQCKNLLNETEYLSSIKAATNGTLSKSGNSITLTATATDCYTSPFFANDNGYRIPVSPNTTYILSWESDNSNYGIIHVFMNGIIAKQQSANNSVTKYLKFITDIDTTFITIRFNVKNSGDSITYSNIMLRYADITDDTYEPYQQSLQEQIKALEERISALEGGV